MFQRRLGRARPVFLAGPLLLVVALLLLLVVVMPPVAQAKDVDLLKPLDDAAAGEEDAPADWTRTQRQHNKRARPGRQRRGGRRLETHVDEDEVLNLVQHAPVELTLEEAKDWQHVKRRLSEARDKSGFFHRVKDAFIPPTSALRADGGATDAGVPPADEHEEAQEAAAAMKEAEREFHIFNHARRLQQQNRRGAAAAAAAAGGV